MVKKINTFTLSAAICLITQSSWILPANSSNEPQVSRLTLRVPRSNTFLPFSLPLDTEQYQEMQNGWFRELLLACSQNSRASGQPFGISKARYFLPPSQTPAPDNSVMVVVGCITNNSGRIINGYHEVSFNCPGKNVADARFETFRSAFGGPRHSSGVTLILSNPSTPIDYASGFFAILLPVNTKTATCFIQWSSPPGQTETYVPVERLDITIER